MRPVIDAVLGTLFALLPALAIMAVGTFWAHGIGPDTRYDWHWFYAVVAAVVSFVLMYVGMGLYPIQGDSVSFKSGSVITLLGIGVLLITLRRLMFLPRKVTREESGNRFQEFLASQGGSIFVMRALGYWLILGAVLISVTSLTD